MRNKLLCEELGEIACELMDMDDAQVLPMRLKRLGPKIVRISNEIEQLERRADGLSYREQEVLELRFGLSGGFPHSYEQIEMLLKIPYEEIRHIEKQGQKKSAASSVHMPRTEVYQLRLTRQEKDELAEKARGEGVSIAKLIRWRLGLDTKDEKSLDAGPPNNLSAAIHAEKEELLRPFHQRVKQLEASGTSPERAERQARRELGL